jgi:MFS family permease
MADLRGETEEARDERCDDERCLEEIEADVEAPTTTLIGRTIFKGGVLSALGTRDYRLFWSGALLSNVGTWIHTIALLWLVKILTNSNTWVGAVNLATYLPVILFVQYAGSLADRVNRKKMIFISQTVMLLGALALAIYTSLGFASMGVLMTVTLVMGVAFAFNFPPWQAILPDLVAPEDLLNGIALTSAQFNLARFVGPALGAAILGFAGVTRADPSGVSIAFYVNSASFLTVLAAIALMKTKTPGYPPPPEGTRRHIMEGMRYVWDNRWAVNILTILGITAFFGLPYIVLMPSVARDVLHMQASAYGWLLGLSGLGAVIGAPLVTYLNRYVKERDIIKISTLGLGVFLIAFSLSRAYWLSLVLAVGLGVTFIMIGSSINTILQSRVERSIRGRVMSFYVLGLLGALPLGGFFLGVVSDIKSTPFALFLGGGVCVLLAIFLMLVPGFTRDAVSPPREPAWADDGA